MNAFNVFDKQQTGKILTDDFLGVINNLGEKLTPNEIKEIMKEADLDGDGSIDYAEFVKLMMSKWN